MSETTSDVMRTAMNVVMRVGDFYHDERSLVGRIEAAILAERERCAALVTAMLRFADTTSGADEAIPAALRDPDHWLARNPELASSIRSPYTIGDRSKI